MFPKHKLTVCNIVCCKIIAVQSFFVFLPHNSMFMLLCIIGRVKVS